MTSTNPHHTPTTPTDPAAAPTPPTDPHAPPDPYADTDWPALLDVLAVNIAIPERCFDQRHWCGTKKCLIGHWCAARPDDGLKTRNTPINYVQFNKLTGLKAIGCRFGILWADAVDLFGSVNSNQEEAIGALIEFIQNNAPEQHQAALETLCRTPQQL